ncbi:MAG TPA: MarR family transcriptional regulator [Solirubrobacteraceae bacterium]|nr:MarR family transcriptional regulator [Solirubrobacteraceae bacterium]
MTSPAPALTAPLLDEDTAVRLRIAVARISRRLRPTAAGRAAGLTPTRISVLLNIVRGGETGLSSLAESEDLNPTMLSRVIGELVQSGLVARVSDPGDRRAARVTATPAGCRMAEQIRRERTDALNHALAELNGRDRALIERALPALEGLAQALRERRA